MFSKTFGSIKNSIELIKEHAEAKAFNKVQAEITALHKMIFKLQAEAFELLELHHEIKTKYIQAQDWENKTAPQYGLAELATGVFVYALKTVEGGGQPPHYLCANCFNKQQKSILQRSRRNPLGTFYKCDRCGSEICDHSGAGDPEPSSGDWSAFT
jgi:DNA-directed RNA polymerase subunit M/transcription elongation factor TFIIS